MVVSYAGQCHCGALQVQYQTGILPASWTLRACQCSFCQIHAMLSTSDPAGSLAFQAVQGSALQRYRFGSQSADFLFAASAAFISARSALARLGGSGS